MAGSALRDVGLVCMAGMLGMALLGGSQDTQQSVWAANPVGRVAAGSWGGKLGTRCSPAPLPGCGDGDTPWHPSGSSVLMAMGFWGCAAASGLHGKSECSVLVFICKSCPFVKLSS